MTSETMTHHRARRDSYGSPRGEGERPAAIPPGDFLLDGSPIPVLLLGGALPAAVPACLFPF